MQHLALLSLVIDEYDQAIAYYTQKLRFELLEDTDMGGGKRWVVVAPPGAKGCKILLARAANELQQSRIGNQTGGRVFLFLHSDDFEGDYNNLLLQDVKIVRERTVEEWGIVCVFQDTYGNFWDLIQPTNKQ